MHFCIRIIPVPSNCSLREGTRSFRTLKTMEDYGSASSFHQYLRWYRPVSGKNLSSLSYVVLEQQTYRTALMEEEEIQRPDDEKEALRIVLAVVAAVTTIVFVLVIALLLYVFVQAKKPTPPEEEDDVFVDNAMISERAKRSIPRVRFTGEYGDETMNHGLS